MTSTTPETERLRSSRRTPVRRGALQRPAARAHRRGVRAVETESWMELQSELQRLEREREDLRPAPPRRRATIEKRGPCQVGFAAAHPAGYALDGPIPERRPGSHDAHQDDRTVGVAALVVRVRRVRRPVALLPGRPTRSASPSTSTTRASRSPPVGRRRAGHLHGHQPGQPRSRWRSLGGRRSPAPPRSTRRARPRCR